MISYSAKLEYALVGSSATFLAFYIMSLLGISMSADGLVLCSASMVVAALVVGTIRRQNE